MTLNFLCGTNKQTLLNKVAELVELDIYDESKEEVLIITQKGYKLKYENLIRTIIKKDKRYREKGTPNQITTYRTNLDPRGKEKP